MVISIERTASAVSVAFWSVMPFTERKSFIRLSSKRMILLYLQIFNTDYILFKSSVSSLFLKYYFSFANFQRRYSYTIYSDKKRKGVGHIICLPVNLLFWRKAKFIHFRYTLFLCGKTDNKFAIIRLSNSFSQLLKLINYSCSSYPARASYSGHSGGWI